MVAMTKKELIEKFTSNISKTPGVDKPDLSKNPFLIQKMEKAAARLKNTPFPDAIKNRRK
jgi:hypothetical protein